MSHLEPLLVARSHRDGHGYRSAFLRHRRLAAQPLVLAMYELGAEHFSAAALAFGQSRNDMSLLVAGEPRNRALAFDMLAKFADWFIPWFEQPAQIRDQQGVSATAPQIVVPNDATVDMIGRLGRRLAYLSLDGPQPADPTLIRLGQHLQFLARHAHSPGQQLIVSVATLVATHWITAQSDLERASLAALDAYVDPAGSPAWGWELERRGLPSSAQWDDVRLHAHGFEAAAIAERFSVGPVPSGEDDARLEPLLAAFNQARSGRTDRAFVLPLLDPIRRHYAALLDRTWELVWHAIEREAAYPEAPSVPRRWEQDRRDYSSHLDWTRTVGHRRTRQTPRQAAITMRRMEAEKARVQAEEACDDPVRMIPSILDGRAIVGEVVARDLIHAEVVKVRTARRPLLTLLTDELCPMPVGRRLWWSEYPRGKAWIIDRVVPLPDGGSLVTLKLTTSSGPPMPALGTQACFSIHTTEQWMPQLPHTVPWPYRPPVPPASPTAIEEVAS